LLTPFKITILDYSEHSLIGLIKKKRLMQLKSSNIPLYEKKSLNFG